MNETGYIKSVHRQLSSDVYRWKINDRFTNGVPDAWYCGHSGSIWVEYKYVDLPARDDTLVKALLSKNQLQWLRDRYAQNENVAVVVGSPEGALWAMHKHNVELVYDGVRKDDFLKNARTPKEIAREIERECLHQDPEYF